MKAEDRLLLNSMGVVACMLIDALAAHGEYHDFELHPNEREGCNEMQKGSVDWTSENAVAELFFTRFLMELVCVIDAC